MIFKQVLFDDFHSMQLSSLRINCFYYISYQFLFFLVSWQPYTDHSLISFKINHEKVTPNSIWSRDWRKYDKMTLICELSVLDWNFSSDLVQDYWNQLEVQLIAVVNKIAPLANVVNNTVETTTPSFIKIEMDWLNLSYNTYKVKCKKLFL